MMKSQQVLILARNRNLVYLFSPSKQKTVLNSLSKFYFKTFIFRIKVKNIQEIPILSTKFNSESLHKNTKLLIKYQFDSSLGFCKKFPLFPPSSSMLLIDLLIFFPMPRGRITKVFNFFVDLSDPLLFLIVYLL